MDNQAQDGEIVNTSPTPKKEVNTLSFPEAIAAVIDGKRINKLEWNDKGIFGFLSEDGRLKINLTTTLSDWILSDGDLKGTDWVVLEEVN